MAKNAFSCPDSHVWIITSLGPLAFWIMCKFCGCHVKVLRFGGLRALDQLNAIMSDPDSRRDPEHFPPKYEAVKHLIKGAKHEDKPDSNPFVD